MTEQDKTATGGKNRKIQIRTPRPGSWTKAKRTLFLDHLAVTSNATHAARHAGMAVQSANYLRRRDPVFAEQWDEALEQGYAHIEALLLARALGQNADPERTGDPGAIPFDPELGLRVLAMRKGLANPRSRRGGNILKRVTIDQVEDSLRRKLDALAKRLKVEL